MNINTKIAVIIPAAGRSCRMQGVDKVFLDLAGKPVLVRTIEVFRAVLGRFVPVIVAMGSHNLLRGQEVLRDMAHVSVIAGGESRQQSVARALAQVDEGVEYILVHDGARPLLKPDDLEAFIRQALEGDRSEMPHGSERSNGSEAWIMAVSVKDTVKRAERNGKVIETLCRDELWLAQTPQMFKGSLLRAVHAEAMAQGFEGTDEAALVEWRGYPVTVLQGSYDNIKITTLEDMRYARSVFKDEEQPILRCGLGYDMHTLVEGRPLVLGGVVIPYERGLLGHSDADVLIHSLMDALLGALSLGDIGKVFPDSEERYKGISSLLLLKEVMDRVRESGYAICHLDTVVCAQMPRLSPYIESMRRNLAACLGLPMDRISVKATTTEGLGPEGRGEGMSARTVVMLGKDFVPG